MNNHPRSPTCVNNHMSARFSVNRRCYKCITQSRLREISQKRISLSINHFQPAQLFLTGSAHSGPLLLGHPFHGVHPQLIQSGFHLVPLKPSLRCVQNRAYFIITQEQNVAYVRFSTFVTGWHSSAFPRTAAARPYLQYNRFFINVKLQKSAF